MKQPKIEIYNEKADVTAIPACEDHNYAKSNCCYNNFSTPCNLPICDRFLYSHKHMLSKYHVLNKTSNLLCTKHITAQVDNSMEDDSGRLLIHPKIDSDLDKTAESLFPLFPI